MAITGRLVQLEPTALDALVAILLCSLLAYSIELNDKLDLPPTDASYLYWLLYALSVALACEWYLAWRGLVWSVELLLPLVTVGYLFAQVRDIVGRRVWVGATAPQSRCRGRSLSGSS